MALLLFIALRLLLAGITAPIDTSQTPSESFVAKKWTVEDGLPVNAVNNLIQDGQGYIWFTTYDGIVRFNGIDFKVFTHANTPQLPQNRAVFIYEQKDTGIWVSLENGGVVLIRNGEFTHYDEEEGFVSADVSSMLEDSQGRMWFGTNEGLYSYQDSTFSRAFKRRSPNQNRIISIRESSDGSIWAPTYEGLVELRDGDLTIYEREPGTVQNQFIVTHRMADEQLLVGGQTGLYVLQNGEIIRPPAFQMLEDEAVLAIYEDEEVLLVSTDRGLYQYDDFIQKLTHTGSSYASFLHFFRDSRGILWMVRNNGQMMRYRNGTIEEVDNFGGADDYHVNRIREDREGNVWLTTARNGVVRLKRAKARTLGEPEGLTGGNILGLFEDSRGRFWVGTRDEGLNMIEGDAVTHYREPRLASEIVHTITEGPDGAIWVGFYQQGIQKIADDGIESYDLGYGASLNDVRALYVSRDSTIWAGTYGGLVRFDPENGDHAIYTPDDGLAGSLVRYIDEDSSGGLWVGTADGGVSYFKEGAFTTYSVDDGLSSDNIRSVYVDDKTGSTVWVGTENSGLNRIRNGEVASVSKEDGLPDHIIHYIEQDDLGWLWMSSNRGIFKIDKNELNDYLDGTSDYFQIIHYGNGEGMRNPEANGGFYKGGLKTSNDTFWFATQEGVSIFEIDPSVKNEVAPTVYVRSVNAEGETYPVENAVLKTGIDDFIVRYNALTFATPGKTPFRYKLQGYDEEWREVRNTREIVYNNVPPGTYTFQVLAANNDGIWSDEVATATIRITPLLYQRPWFYPLLFLLAVAGFYGASRLRYRYLLKRQRRMQHIIDEQTATLRKEKREVQQKNEIIEEQARELEQSNKAKDKFLSIIGHDLRNPFQALVGYSSMLSQGYEEMDDREVKESLDEIEKASERLLDLVNNLLKWASLQTQKLKPEPDRFEAKRLVEHNVQLFTPSADQKGIDLTAETKDACELYADRNMINTVVRNLVSNAIKFTQTGGTVTIAAFANGGDCVFRVSDTGIGMPPAMVDDLMKVDRNTSRFGTDKEVGTGLGLVVCKEMIELHRGSITVASEEGEGTVFTVRLPQDYDSSEV